MEAPNQFFHTSQVQLTYEQLVVKCNEVGYVILTKTDSGFAIDVYKPGRHLKTVSVSKKLECTEV